MIVVYALLLSAGVCIIPITISVETRDKKVKVLTANFLFWAAIMAVLLLLFWVAARHWYEIEFWFELLWIWLWMDIKDQFWSMWDV